MTSPSIPYNLHADPITALKELCDAYPTQVVFTTSFGIEDQILTDLIFRNNLNVRLATLDTGRLFPETYNLIDKTKSRYDLEIESYFPDTLSLEEFVNSQGMNSIFKSIESRKTCCSIRKIDPLFRALEDSSVWVTGLRMEQSKNRSDINRISVDSLSGILKFNPLITWSDADIEDYIEKHNVPINILHKKGFPSIGCAPCTRAISPNEHPRAGRWWWEHSSQECGLHKG